MNADKNISDRTCRHGWRGTTPEDGERIVTPCPHCGCQSLFIGKGGHLTCARVPAGRSDGCGNPSVADAVAQLKRDRDELLEALRGMVQQFRAYALPGARLASCQQAEALLAKHHPQPATRESRAGGAQ